jgi:hypothetical protein
LRAATDDKLELPKWDTSLNLRWGAGWKDNVLLAPTAPKASAFIASGLDLMVLRLPTERTEFVFFVSADDRRYLQHAGTDKEEMVMAEAQIKQFLSADWQAGLRVQGIYENMVFDASASETELTSVKFQGPGLGLHPSLRKDFNGGWYFEGEFEITRQYLAAPLDNYWQGGPRLTLGREYGKRSELALSYAVLRQSYDRRSQVSLDSVPVPDTALAYLTHEVELAWRHQWDSAKRWRTATKLKYQHLGDNGSGYFDYNKYVFAQELRYRAPGWEISGQGKINRYDYASRYASLDPQSKRWVTGFAANLRGEKSLVRKLKVYLEFEYERYLSNESTMEYEATTLSSGLNWEF